MKLTAIQRRVIDSFRHRANTGQAPPTYRELCKEFGWQSTGTARDHLKALRRKGAIGLGSHKARGTHLSEEPVAEAVRLPLVGRIVAGQPVVSDELVEGYIPIPGFLAPANGGFLLRVSGDSMEGAGIFDGDIVVVRETNVPQPGHVVAATISGETTLKRLEKRGRAWVLVPENPKYSAIEIDSDDTHIRGVATGVLRALRRGTRGSEPGR